MALGCSILALTLLLAHALPWVSFRPVSRAVLPPAGEVLEGTAPFRFAVVGDSRGNMDVLESILERMKADKASLILHGGDLVSVCATDDFEWVLHELEEAQIGVPFCAVPGNHDVAKGESDANARCRLYSRSFGPRQYWFAYANALFVGLDTAASGCQSEDLQWLDRTLARLRDRYEACFVYTHTPPRDPRPNHSKQMEVGAEELARILKRHRVSALFASHIHSYLEDRVEGIPVYISGGGGATRAEPLGSYHYLLCSVEPGGAFRVEKKDVAREHSADYWEYELLVELPRRMGTVSLATLMAASILFSVLAGVARRRSRASESQAREGATGPATGC